MRYSMIWQENKDGRGWAEWRDLTSDDYHAKWEELRDQGYRPTDVEGYLVNGQQRFAGIWVENVEGLQWYSQRGLTAAEYGTVFDERMGMGWRLVDMEAYPTPSGLRYACIWVDNNQTNLAWAQYRDMSRETYQQRIEEFASGYRVIDYESYQSDGQQRYAAIWEEDNSGRAEQVRTDRTETEFANLWRDYADQGYRLVDFERYDTASGPRYGGVWRENNFRFRWTRKSDVNTAVDSYYTTFGSNGALSVAVMQNGRMLYRRGVGVANQATGANAYGDSIYALASISKVIGGTLAVKLQDEQVLADGTPLVQTLDLSDQTITYLPGLDTADAANVHTHTVDQLLAHLGCIPHYPGWGDLDGTHYATALAASQALWNNSTALVSGCTIGVNRNYSTHAFTFVGAVLEDATGRSISRLIQEEIANQFGFDTMRALYAQSTIPANDDRVVGLESNGTEDTPVNISWKVLGGGIESSAVDLVRFGNRVLDGTIVTPATRDNVLWSRVAPNSNNGRAWELRTLGGRRVAEHGGAGTNGNRTRTHLRVYRDDGLVIAVLRNNRINENVDDLVDDIADEVFAP